MTGRRHPAPPWQAVHAFALSLPDAWEDHPWGETVVKVNKKVFAFLGSADGEPVRMTVKLTASLDHALSLQDAAPAGYGLGRSGWVVVPLTGLDVDLLTDWVEESYRNVAPKRLAARLDGRPDSRRGRNLPMA